MPICCQEPKLRFDWHYGHRVGDEDYLVVRVDLIVCDTCGTAFRLADDGELLTIDDDRTGFVFHVTQVKVH